MKRLLMLVAVLVAVALAAPSWAAIEFFGTAKVKPTYFSNFDLNDKDDDSAIGTESGGVVGGHLRSELRFGWKAAGDRWSVKMIAETDVIMTKNSADHGDKVGVSYDAATNKYATTDDGADFGIERVELLYKFAPSIELQTGWDIRALDIKSGGLLYGDDHPFIGFRGQLAEKTKYELLYIPIQNVGGAKDGADVISDEVNDWSVYSLKINQQMGGFNVSPFFAYSDNDSREAQVMYYGLEVTGKAGLFKPSFEIVAADGEFDSGADISSLAAFVGVEMDVCKAFTPYVALRYTQGDDDASDDDVEGWVGITDIGRFTPLMGMDGGILSEDLGQSYGARLYSYAPEGAVGSNPYGGIGNGGFGDNPGSIVAALGAKGDLSSIADKLSYKTQVFMIWYDETDNLNQLDGSTKDVDDYAGTTFDFQLKYALDANFSIDYIFGVLVPGDGLEDQYGDDTAMTNCLTLSWKY